MTRRRTLLTALAAVVAAPAFGASACPPLLRHTLPRLQDEQPVDLCRFAGRVLLVVNTASRCGYTPQYEGLAELHRRYGARGLTILGFPANDFGGQEPAANADVARFCENQFDVRFPLFAKSVVVAGPQRNPLYAALAERSGVSPGWNFHKYLVSRDGRQVTSFPSAVAPEDPALVKDIERLLLSKQH
jgi:glutathione peroxidase